MKGTKAARFCLGSAATDDAVISAPGSYTVTIAAAESFEVDSLAFDPGTGGTLAVNGTLTLGGPLAEMAVGSGTVNVGGVLSGGTLALNGGTFQVQNSGIATFSAASNSG